MDLRLHHGLNEEQVNTYSFIFTTDVFSIAEYDGRTNRKMTSFAHSHDSYEFIIPYNTIPLLRYQNANYIGEVGYCYPVNPMVMHGIEFELESTLIDIVVDKNYLNNIKKELGFEADYFYTRFLVSKELVQTMCMLKASKSNELIEQVVKILIQDGLSSHIDNRKPPKKYFKNMRSSIKYMMDNYLNPDLKIEDIAKESNYSYTYFTKAFKKYMNDTPINHINKLRLSKAKELMKDKRLSLEEIAKQSGYKTQSNFTEAFKRVIGMNPNEYRKKYC